MIIYMFVFGWGLYFTKSLSQKAVMTAFALILFSYNPIPSVAIWLVAGSLAAVWVPSLVVVPPVKLVFSKIAASSFYIFLVHMVPVQVVLYGIKSTSLPLTLAAFTAALLLGIGLGWGVRRAESLMTTTIRSLVLRVQPGRGRAPA